MDKPRKIIHIDMDAFFASIEQLDNPALRGKPVIVGGAPNSRGVVAACSYEARKFGIHSAMPCAQAYRLCRHAVFVRPRRERYVEVSRSVMKIFQKYTNLIEPLSIDEAFLDITVNRLNNPSATRVAEILLEDIRRTTALTASAGVSYNKFLAKIASDQNKPDGLTVIPPEKASEFIRTLPIRKFYGIGKVTEQKLKTLGIHSGHDLERLSEEEMRAILGKNGSFYYQMVRGIDNRPVQPRRTRKSLGTETTFQIDIFSLREVLDVLSRLSEQVGHALKEKEIGGKTLTLKIRYDDFTTITRSLSRSEGFFNQEDIAPSIPRLVAATEAGRRKIRLLGLTVSNLLPADDRDCGRYRQLSLPFPAPVTLSPLNQVRFFRQTETTTGMGGKHD